MDLQVPDSRAAADEPEIARHWAALPALAPLYQWRQRLRLTDSLLGRDLEAAAGILLVKVSASAQHWQLNSLATCRGQYPGLQLEVDVGFGLGA